MLSRTRWAGREANKGQDRRDWTPMPLALIIWLCALPLVFLLLGPWLGLRVAITTALVLLAVIMAACWALCFTGNIRRDGGET
jgi:hypothetical protein